MLCPVGGRQAVPMRASVAVAPQRCRSSVVGLLVWAAWICSVVRPGVVVELEVGVGEHLGLGAVVG
jgi:hypothetical protein